MVLKLRPWTAAPIHRFPITAARVCDVACRESLLDRRAMSQNRLIGDVALSHGACQGGEARAADRQDGAKRHFAYRSCIHDVRFP
jgi:hypothetical protein